MKVIKIGKCEFCSIGTTEETYVCDRAVFVAKFDEDGGDRWDESSGKRLLERWFEENATEEIKNSFYVDILTAHEAFMDLCPITDGPMGRKRKFKGKPIGWFTKSKYSDEEVSVWFVAPWGGFHFTIMDSEYGFVPVLRKKKELE